MSTTEAPLSSSALPAVESSTAAVVVAPQTPSKASSAKPGTVVSSIRRSARVLQHDVIVAPGFGTLRDVQSLATALSEGHPTPFPVPAVLAMMKSNGRGLRNRKDAAAADDPAAAPLAPAVSTAWADFMKEEGVGTTQDSPAAKSGSAKRSATQDDAKPAAKAAAAAPTAKRTYLEPETPTRPSKKSKSSVTSGVLVQAGTLDSTIVGRAKLPKEAASYHLPLPTRILDAKIQVTKVFTACHAAHSFCLDTAGSLYGWGRNESAQLGSNLPTAVALPEKLELSGPAVAAACGKHHSVVLLQDDSLWAVGANKVGQCGVKTFTDIPNFRKCVLPEDEAEDVTVKQIECGEDFTVALSTAGHVYSCGSSEFGQLGNGETGEYFVTANKIAFANCNILTIRRDYHYAPTEKLHVNNETCKTVALPDQGAIRIDQLAVGKHHVVAVERASSTHKSRVFAWGCGNYGCLGHGLQADEYFPRLVGVLQALPIGSPGDRLSVSAGATCSLLKTAAGHVYYWGKHRSVGEATMRPTLMDTLAHNSHVVTLCKAGNQSLVCCTANAQTVCSGQGPHGELGLGQKKSSAKPAFVDALDGVQVLDLACGYGHTLFVAEKAAANKLSQLDKAAKEELEHVVETKRKK